MTEYLTYPTSNLTSLTSALQYGATVLNTASGADVFFPFMLFVFNIGAMVLGDRYGFERAVLFANLFSLVVAALLVAASLLNPIWLLLSVIITAAVFFVGW